MCGPVVEEAVLGAGVFDESGGAVVFFHAGEEGVEEGGRAPGIFFAAEDECGGGGMVDEVGR